MNLNKNNRIVLWLSLRSGPSRRKTRLWFATAPQPPCAARARSSKLVVPPLGRKRLGCHGMNLRLTLPPKSGTTN